MVPCHSLPHMEILPILNRQICTSEEVFVKNHPLFVFWTHFTVLNSETKEKYTDIYLYICLIYIYIYILYLYIYIVICLLNAFYSQNDTSVLSEDKLS